MVGVCGRRGPNRLVAAELERRWNAALTVQTQLEAELLAMEGARERPLSESTKRELLLSESAWWIDYYGPMETRLAS